MEKIIHYFKRLWVGSAEIERANNDEAINAMRQLVESPVFPVLVRELITLREYYVAGLQSTSQRDILIGKIAGIDEVLAGIITTAEKRLSTEKLSTFKYAKNA